jgi:hypothetical protein
MIVYLYIKLIKYNEIGNLFNVYIVEDL